MRTLKRVNKLIVHHSAYPMDKTTLKDIVAWHDARNLADQGFSAYHAHIPPDGETVPDRPEMFQGNHCYAHNHNSLGICVWGDFRTEIPTEAQIDSLIEWLVPRVKKHNLTPKDVCILGHMDAKFLFKIKTTTTSCPGENLHKLLPKIRQRIAPQVGYWPVDRKSFVEKLKDILRG